EVLARYHFPGAAQLAKNPAAAKLKEIWGLPESRRLVEQTLQKLSHAPKTLYGGQVTPAQDERGAAILRPLLDDLLNHESFLQVRGTADRTAEWTLLVHLPSDRRNAWTAGLSELLLLWNLGAPTTNAVEGFDGWELKRKDAPNVIRYVLAGDWLALGVGHNALPAFEEAVRRVKAGGRPIANASTYWLEAELNLPHLVETLSLSPAFKWPQTKLSVVGTGENLRSNARMVFPAPVTGRLDPWRVPTNLINEPLISFTAARGIAPLLSDLKTLQELGFNPAPNELYAWAQSAVAFQSFVAFPFAGGADHLPRVADRAPSLLGTNWQQRGLTQIEWQATNTQVFWKALPFITPYLRPARFGGADFVVGGLFPAVPVTNPPPGDLLVQFLGRKDLVYYNWEITEARLAQWRVMAQLFAVIADKPQLTTNSAALPWLIKVESQLGNTVTEIASASPKEWTLVRKSHLGFTGAELVGLARWLESTNFPSLSFDLPRDRPLPSLKPPAAQE
ncbi:MAG TPA: hypothetical protein VJW76_07995, partial [Verrucomicrobiae bacterium]|nr:hypothetical protein [Verrucomicrobiae bacterium]